jgi:CubicO group peptidase (beta-lactamase class C family)
MIDRQSQMFRLRLRFVGALLILLAGATANEVWAQEAKLSPQKQAQIEEAVAKFMSSTHVPGLSVAVVDNGEFEWASGFGLADRREQCPRQRAHSIPAGVHFEITDGHSRDATKGARSARP